jgi:hopene-associated glycosyltransferase HpnB
MVVLAGFAVAAVIAWVDLLLGHGRFWRTDQRLPQAPEPPEWPDVVAVVPARGEAAVLPQTLGTLLGQDYAGDFRLILVDDQSSDSTASTALAMDPHGVRLAVVRGVEPPTGWAGKVWAMSQGLSHAGDPEYFLFTDADIAFGPEAIADLVRVAEANRLELVSQMARLHAATGWERLLIPAFVYFFAQLYPFRRVNRARSQTAAAAGGCMLVRRSALEAAGGLERIKGALIDDVSLAKLLKRNGAHIWLGHATDVTSVRPHPRLLDTWDMVARSAYTQLRHSLALLAGTVAGLLFLYVLPPVAGIVGLTALSSSAGKVAADCGLGAWALMAITEAPILRLYGLSPARGVALPFVALLYTAMTVDSARRHLGGKGGQWKGRSEAARRS